MALIADQQVTGAVDELRVPPQLVVGDDQEPLRGEIAELSELRQGLLLAALHDRGLEPLVPKPLLHLLLPVATQ